MQGFYSGQVCIIARRAITHVADDRNVCEMRSFVAVNVGVRIGTPTAFHYYGTPPDFARDWRSDGANPMPAGTSVAINDQ